MRAEVYSSLAGSEVDAYQYLAQLGKLFIGRWIGLEGVAAVDSFLFKGWELMAYALVEDSSSSNGLYQRICQSAFVGKGTHVLMGSEPGLVAFLWYSGSLWVVFFGSIIIPILFWWLTVFLGRLALYNQYILAFIGCNFANLLMQFVSPIKPLIYCIELVVSIVLYHIIVRFFLYRGEMRGGLWLGR